MKKKKGYSNDTPVSGRHRARPGTQSIFGLAKQLGLEIDDIRTIAKDISGIASISQLTNHQTNELIRRLGQKIKAANRSRKKNNTAAGTSRGKYVDHEKEIEIRFKPNPPWCITRGQREKINELMVELDWHMPGLLSWTQKQRFGFGDHPGNAAQASALIVRLIAVRRADLARRAGPGAH